VKKQHCTFSLLPSAEKIKFKIKKQMMEAYITLVAARKFHKDALVSDKTKVLYKSATSVDSHDDIAVLQFFKKRCKGKMEYKDRARDEIQ
jgi:hypothetical protein